MAKNKIKVIFFTPVPYEGAGCRFRISQYLPFLKSRGYECDIRPFLSSQFFRLVYKKGRFPGKIFYYLLSLLRRLRDLALIGRYDLIFIYREVLPFCSAWYENLLFRAGKPVIFDFDDAIFLSNYSANNKFTRFLKDPRRAAWMIRRSSAVIAGNSYLKEFAAEYNKNVYLIPTVVDTENFPVKAAADGSNVVIGWIGTPTTGEFLKPLAGVFRRLLADFSFLKIKIIGAEFSSIDDPRILNVEWSLEKEMEEIISFDIGIMPMPDNEWAKGKCGFKAIQYMAGGVCAVAENAGINGSIISDGENGFLAKGEDEWYKKLSALIKDRGLRLRLGENGRRTVEQKYSLAAYSGKFADVFDEAAADK